MYTVAVNSCDWRCSILVELPCVSLGLLPHHRSIMSLYGIVRTPLYRSMVPSLAHHQVLVQSQTPTQKTRIWLCETILAKCHCGQKCDGRNLIVLDPWSLCFDICLCTSSVTPRSHNLSSSLNSSKCGHHAWYCS